MAFDINRFVRVTSAYNAGQITTSFNPSATPALSNGPAVFTYASAADTVAQIGAADYFASMVYDLAVNDWIFATGSDASAFYQVLTVDRDAGTITLGSAFPSGVIGTANIQNDAVTTAKILNGNVTLAKLATGIAPSHVIKFGGQVTTAGGSASEAITVTGAVAATDLAFVQVVDNGSNDVTVLQAVVTADTLTVTFSADPGADCIINYQLIRAAA
jgi:hypothetical protein